MRRAGGNSERTRGGSTHAVNRKRKLRHGDFYNVSFIDPFFFFVGIFNESQRAVKVFSLAFPFE